MSFGPGFPYLPAFSAPQLILSTSLANKPSSSSDSVNISSAGGLLNGSSENMSAETLRFLAANHNFPPHLLPLGPRMDPGSGMPMQLEQFRSLPPGLSPLNMYPGIGGPGGPMDLKGDPLSAALAHSQGGLPPYYYDPCFGGGYPYGDRFGNALDLNGARRKNATRETTAALKAWLYEHRKNPYPTKGEKIMLAIITKMTLTQVSTWFANARRRLKKENKMTWSPRNRTGEDDDDDDDHIDDHNQTGVDSSERPASSQSSLLGDIGRSDDEDDDAAKQALNNATSILRDNHESTSETNNNCAEKLGVSEDAACKSASVGEKRPADAEPATPTKKPKIWSIADTVNSPSPSSQRPKTVVEPPAAPTPAAPTPMNLQSPFHLTFPPWPNHMAMFPRPPMIPMPSSAGGFVPPPFMPMMGQRQQELLFRGMVPMSAAPGLLTFSQNAAAAMAMAGNMVPPSSGASMSFDILKLQQANNQNVANSVSPISSTSSVGASSPRNVVAKVSSSSTSQLAVGEKK